MNLNWVIVIFIFNEVSGLKKCPQECLCNFDVQNRKQTICLKGGLKNIPTQSIDSLTQSITIKGPRNFITLSSIFQTFNKLEELRIIDSNIPSIGKNTFWGVPSLRIIDLSKNNITTLTEENFRGQDNLIELDLSKNNIYKLPSNVFRYLKSLKILNLEENSIDGLYDRPFFMLMGLKLLDLSGNTLQDLPPDVFRDVQELKSLICRRCQLKNINPQLYNLLKHLVELDLGDNQFKYLERDEFSDLKRLTNVKLDGNQLSVVVDNIFQVQTSLKFLDLSRNRLAKITNYAFKNLSNLTFLDLSYNKLSRLEELSVAPLKNLNILNISGNLQLDLNEIRPTLQAIPELTTLSIADMGPLPMGLLLPLGQLQSLNLSGNHLDNNSLQILNPILNLKVLDLSRNQLNGVEENFAVKLQNINDVRLENNPLICDRCHMGPLIDKAENLKWQPPPICFLPESLRGYGITDLDSTKIDQCIELIIDEDHDAASTSHNFLDQGGMGTLIVFGGILSIIVTGIVSTTIMCYLRIRGKQQHVTHAESRSELDAAKSLNHSCISTDDDEKNFKFPLHANVCTIDEICIPPPPPPPSSSKSAQPCKEGFD